MTENLRAVFVEEARKVYQAAYEDAPKAVILHSLEELRADREARQRIAIGVLLDWIDSRHFT